MASIVVIGLVMAAAVVAVALLGLGRWEQLRGRSRHLRAAAKAAEYSFLEVNDGRVGRQRFDIFMEGTNVEASNILTTRMHNSRQALAFDYQVIVEYEVYRSPDGSLHRRRKGDSNTIGGQAIAVEIDRLENQGSASVMHIDAFLKNVLVLPHGWPMSPASRLPDNDSFTDRPEPFTRLFRVRSDDDQFADRFLTPKMMKFMAATGGRLGFEIRGSKGIVFAPTVKPEDMVDLSKLAWMWADLIDPDLLAEFPEVQEVDAHGNPQMVVSNNIFPSTDHDEPGPGPIMPEKLSAWSPEVLGAQPELANVEHDNVASAGEPIAAEPAEPAPPPPPEPESVDWSM